MTKEHPDIKRARLALRATKPDSAHFNKLTPAEQERLAHLAEEASEVAVIANKIIRHGWTTIDNSVTPSVVYRNRDLLRHEICDVLGAIYRMATALDIDPKILTETPKISNRYMHHQPPLPFEDSNDNPGDSRPASSVDKKR
jgi:NTP pyrophosphatase (non-canonical NTP hydrolase)